MTDAERATMVQERTDLALHVDMDNYRWRSMQAQRAEDKAEFLARLDKQDAMLRRLLRIAGGLLTAFIGYVLPQLIPFISVFSRN